MKMVLLDGKVSAAVFPPKTYYQKFRRKRGFRHPFPSEKITKVITFPKSFTKSKIISVPILNCVVAWQLSSSLQFSLYKSTYSIQNFLSRSGFRSYDLTDRQTGITTLYIYKDIYRQELWGTQRPLSKVYTYIPLSYHFLGTGKTTQKNFNQILILICNIST